MMDTDEPVAPLGVPIVADVSASVPAAAAPTPVGVASFVDSESDSDSPPTAAGRRRVSSRDTSNSAISNLKHNNMM